MKAGKTSRLNRKAVSWFVGIVAVAIVLAVGVVAQAPKGGGGRKAPAAKGPLPKAAPAKATPTAARDLPGPSTETIGKGTVTIHLVLRNKTEGGRKVPTKWDSAVTIAQGGRIENVRVLPESPFSGATASGFKLTTTRRIPRMQAEVKRGYENMPVLDADVFLTLSGASPNTTLSVDSPQGAFSVALKDVGLGASMDALKGMVTVSRVPSTARILMASTDDDFPAAAYSKDGALYVVYQAFTRGEAFAGGAARLDEEPKDFAFLAAKTGGDQLFLMRLAEGQWAKLGGEAAGRAPVTPPNQDLYKSAVAVDGAGKVWVVWPASVDGNWDLYARSLQGEKWSDAVRLTQDAGPDILPVAATDASGAVWIAWQAFRGDNSNILALRQDASGFGKALVVSDHAANEWAPAIACARDGNVAIAWDTYAKGDYDVYARVWSKGQFDAPVAIATSFKGEARVSATYDPQGRLWVAYEESPEEWGKDWGKEEPDSSGMRLYNERHVRARVLAGGRLMSPLGEPFVETVQAEAAAATVAAKKAPAKAAARGIGLARFSAPRIVADDTGRVWLAARAEQPNARAAVGSVWVERLAYYDGDRWSQSALCPESDGALDSSPALLARPGGGVAMVAPTDGRLALTGALPRGAMAKLGAPAAPQAAAKPQRPVWPDPVNGELTMAEVPGDSLGAPAEPKLAPVGEKPSTEPSPAARAEAQDIARLRAARTTGGGKTLQIMRGEFHRHTEISGDGGNDGMLTDMWRYALDMADMDWIGNGDHDNGGNREYSWWLIQKTTDMFRVPGFFEPMFTYERSCNYPDGHRNVVFPRRGIRPLPRFRTGLGEVMDDLGPDAKRPNSPDTQMLYRYLKQFNGLCASHTSATDMGTDWRDNDPIVEPVVEIYQGDRQNYEMPGAPRSNTADDSAGGWRPFGFVSLALKKGFRLGFQASSDHISTHMSYCNVWAEQPSRAAIYEAMMKRHVYGSTDNILAEFHCGEHFMGDEFTVSAKPSFKVHIVGSKPMAKVHIIKDGAYAYSKDCSEQDVAFEWTDENAQAGKTSYYYVRGEQSDGELVWISPMWITMK